MVVDLEMMIEVPNHRAYRWNAELVIASGFAADRDEEGFARIDPGWDFVRKYFSFRKRRHPSSSVVCRGKVVNADRIACCG